MTENEKIQQDVDFMITVQRVYDFPSGSLHILVGKPIKLPNASIAESVNTLKT